MARFPTYERQQGISGGGRMPYMDGNALTGPARALMGLGNAVGDLGDEFAQTVAKSKNDQTNAQLSKDTSQMQIDMSQQDIEAQQSATGRAENFTADADKRFEDYRKKVLANNPDPDYQQRFNAWADDYRAKYITKAATFQAESAVAQRTSDLATALSNYEQLVYSDPSQYENIRKQSAAALDAAKSWLTPEQETNLRAKHEHDLNLARAKGKADADPAGFLAETGSARGGDNPLARLIDRHEGGGRYDTLFGHAQRKSGAMAGVDVSRMTIGALKQFASSDGAYGREQKAKLGYLATPMGRYQIVGSTLAATAKEMGLPDNTVFSPQVQNAMFNHLVDKRISGPRTMKGKIDSLRSEWEGFKHVSDAQLSQAITAYENGDRGALTGSSNPDVANNPAYAGLSIDEIRSLTNQAETAHNSAQASAYAGLKDQIELGVATGAVTSEQQIIDSGLNGGDVATLLGKFRTANNDRIAVADTLAALNSGTYKGDPYDTDARKNIDNTALALKKQATPEQYRAVTEEIVRQSGIVPKDVVNSIRGGLESRNPSDVADAAQRAQRLSTINPAALARRDGGGEVQTAADDFSFYVDHLNLSPEDAAKRLIESRDPEKQRDRKALEPAAKEFRKTVEDTDIAGLFNDSWFAFDPALGFNAQQAAGIKADFLAIAEDQFFRSNGDADLATARATEEMKRLYGVTTLTGNKVLMKHPPERYWPLSKFMTNSGGPFRDGLGFGADATLGYAQSQLRQDIQTVVPDADLDAVQLVTTPETDAMVKRGEMPAYAVLVKDKSGNYQTIPGKLWRPDFSGAEKANDADAATRRKDAKDEQAAERESIEQMRAVPAFGRD